MMRPLSACLAFAAAILCATAGAAETPAPDAPPRVAPSASRGAVASEAAALYQPNSELDYVPITPCRIFDTRAGAVIKKGKNRTFAVGGATGFPAQGGPEGGCGVPPYAVAVALNLSASGSTVAGAATAYSQSVRPPIVSLSVSAGQAATSGSTVTLATDGSMRVYVNQDMHVFGDVSGYFVKPMAAMVGPSPILYSGSSRAIGVSKSSAGVFEVQFDRNIRYCSAVANVYVAGYYTSTTTWFDDTRPDTVRVMVFNGSGALVDGQYFYLIVRC